MTNRFRSRSLILEFHSDGDRVKGRLEDESGNHHPFSSWLGLLTLIEQARVGATKGASPHYSSDPAALRTPEGAHDREA